jgi:hypothetical protein
MTDFWKKEIQREDPIEYLTYKNLIVHDPSGKGIRSYANAIGSL